MDLDWEHYHRFNIILLSTIGLWPYGNKLVLLLQRFIGSFFTVLCLFANLATFATLNYTTSLLLDNAPCIFVGCAMFIKYMSYLAASDCVKRVTTAIAGDWNGLSCKEEIQIVEKYVERGLFHTKSFAMFICPTALCIILAPLSSVLFDIVIPLNESRNRGFPITFEIFVDQQKYFFILAFAFQCVIVVGALVFLSTESLLIVYVQHACALFEVTSRRIKKFLCATEASDLKKSNHIVVMTQIVIMKCINSIFSKVEGHVGGHCKIIRDNFLRWYLILHIFGSLSLGTHLFRLTQKIAANEFTGILTSGFFSLAILSHIFYVNFLLQDVLDTSNHIFDDFYASEWYKFPQSTQKLVSFCMLNSLKPVPIDCNGIFAPSYEGFALVVRLTLSCVTALFSLQ